MGQRVESAPRRLRAASGRIHQAVAATAKGNQIQIHHRLLRAAHTADLSNFIELAAARQHLAYRRGPLATVGLATLTGS